MNVQVTINDKNQIGRVTRVGSMLPASPPLYITKEGPACYVNGAKIIMRNLKAVSDRGKRRQVLHILDGVLEPLVPEDENDSAAYLGLTAGKLLRNPDTFDLGGYTIG